MVGLDVLNLLGETKMRNARVATEEFNNLEMVKV